MTEEFDKVVGVSFDDCQKVIAKLKKHDKLDFVPEPTNPYDPRAIRVESNGNKVGYVKRDGWLSALIHEGTKPIAEVYQVTGGYRAGATLGLTMKVAY